jgi:hypothetical protein
MGKRRNRYKAERWDERFDWNNDLCTFQQGICKGEIMLWTSPDGHLTMRLCESHSVRMNLAEEAWHAEPAEAGIVVA